MKKIFNKGLALLLSLTFLMLSAGTGATALNPTQTQPKRISVSVHTDALTKGFCWYTDSATDSIVRVYKGAADISSSLTFTSDSCEEWEGSFVHKVTVSGLVGGETYTYKVGDGTLWSNVGTFVTDDGDDRFNFITITDVHARSQDSSQKGADTMRAAFETIANAEFVANLGDYTNDSTNEEWNFYDEAFAALNLSTTQVPVAGNHDGFAVQHWFTNMFNLDTSESVQTTNGVNYSFDYGNAHIAVLNTNDMICISNAQLRWLKNDMNSTAQDWKFIFMHKAPYSLGKNGKWPDATYLQKAIADVCDETGVDLVLSGHDHMYLRTKPLYNNQLTDDGTVYILNGTAGTKRYEIRSFLADTFLDTNFIAGMTVQKDDYGNYWNGSDWHSTLQTNIGGFFSGISVDGGRLTMDAYILADHKDEQGQDIITKIDTMTLSKATGQNTASYHGNNTTSKVAYALQTVPSVLKLAGFVFSDWLPKFLRIVPNIIKVYIEEGVF